MHTSTHYYTNRNKDVLHHERRKMVIYAQTHSLRAAARTMGWRALRCVHGYGDMMKIRMRSSMIDDHLPPPIRIVWTMRGRKGVWRWYGNGKREA